MLNFFIYKFSSFCLAEFCVSNQDLFKKTIDERFLFALIEKLDVWILIEPWVSFILRSTTKSYHVFENALRRYSEVNKHILPGYENKIKVFFPVGSSYSTQLSMALDFSSIAIQIECCILA